MQLVSPLDGRRKIYGIQITGIGFLMKINTPAETMSIPLDSRQVHELFLTIFSETREALFLSDSNGILLAVNPQAVALSGFTAEEICGMPFADLLETRTDAIGKTQEHYFRHKVGGMHPVVIAFRDLQDAMRIYFVREVTEQISSAESAYENRYLLSSIFRAAPWGIGVVKKRILIAVNDRICEMVGYSQKELLGKSARILYPSDADFEYVGFEKYRQLSLHAIGTVETRWQHKNGQIIDVLMSSSPIYPPDLTREITFTVLDITARKKAEAEKEKLQAELLQAQKMESIGRLAGGVAHDFNNMLSVIIGHTELSAMQIDPNAPIQDGLREIKKAAERSADLTRQLLVFARKQMTNPIMLDLNEVVAGMLKMLRRIIGENVELIWMPKKDLWPAKIDPTQVDQIVANLTVNARDAIPGVGKITIETANAFVDEVYCSNHPGSVPGEYVMFALSDTGQGMTKDIQARMFEPFFTTKSLGQGTGLGLATVYGIVQQNEGFIHVYSEPGQGTTIRIYLPRCMEGNVALSTLKSGTTPAGHGETVLLVEDEESVLNISRAMLERQGYSVLTATTPDEALHIARSFSGKIHLLITDLIMPGMNGRDLAMQIKATRQDLACLFMSGYTANVIVRQGVLDPGVNFISKPFSLEELATKVWEVLASQAQKSS
jgi:two-component system, cell cycle sensor histidine kinase and response regulator CckA